MAEKKYRTRQRDSILAYFAAHPEDSFSAKDIIENAAIEVSMATVFRCLTHLAAEGMIKKYASEDGARYQYNPEGACNHHFHLKCLACGKIVHLNCELMDSVSEHIAKDHRFILDVSRTVIYGHCEDCRNLIL